MPMPGLIRKIQDMIIANLAVGGTLVSAGNPVPTDVGAVAPPSTVYNGLNTVTTAATREALAGAQALSAGVQIKAEADNTGIIYVGDATVAAANGYQLAAGETVFISIDNLDEVYLDTSVNTDGVTFIAS